MNRSYNHIKHLVNNNDIVKSSKQLPDNSEWVHDPNLKQQSNQLDDKQRHSGFDYYEYNMLKFGTPSGAQSSLDRITSLSSLNFQEYLEDPEHDQPRHQSIHGHGCGETC